ncbi:hypothetical protein [Anaerofustis stercorihominis]|nr:hypothetical protein [Anaerofustis stercorihominis]
MRKFTALNNCEIILLNRQKDIKFNNHPMNAKYMLKAVHFIHLILT